MKSNLTIIRGGNGRLSVYLNDYRITDRSTKPLGGGHIIMEFDVDIEEIKKALDIKS